MSSRFLAFINWILKWETEYNKNGTVRTEHDPNDSGGTTKFGIDQRSHPKVDIDNLTKDQAISIYYGEWTSEKCETMPAKLGEVYFNCCVNCGQSRANKLLIQSKNNAAGFITAQEAFYQQLANRRPASKKYLKGWLNRTQDLRKFLNIA